MLTKRFLRAELGFDWARTPSALHEKAYRRSCTKQHQFSFILLWSFFFVFSSGSHEWSAAPISTCLSWAKWLLTFAVNVALVASQCQHLAWTVPLHPPINAEAGQAASTLSQVYGVTRPGTEHSLLAWMARAQVTVPHSRRKKQHHYTVNTATNEILKKHGLYRSETRSILPWVGMHIMEHRILRIRIQHSEFLRIFRFEINLK